MVRMGGNRMDKDGDLCGGIRAHRRKCNGLRSTRWERRERTIEMGVALGVRIEKGMNNTREKWRLQTNYVRRVDNRSLDGTRGR